MCAASIRSGRPSCLSLETRAGAHRVDFTLRSFAIPTKDLRSISRISGNEKMTTLRQKLASLPAARQKKIAARAEELALQETTLGEARKSTRKTQSVIAGRLKIGQDSVSRLKKRSDMLVSTLREYVAALGGRVRLVVEFEGQPPMELEKIGKPAPKRVRSLKPSSSKKASGKSA